MNKLRVAFQGRPGAYSESASFLLCGVDIDTIPCYFFEDIFEALLDGQVDYGVIPIENTTTGSVYQNYLNLLKYKIPIVGETKLKIEHSLMALPGVGLDSLKRVLSHEQALGQCSDFFREHPAILAEATFDTAGSAELISKNCDKNCGAIASFHAAKKYGLEILQNNIENNNSTNFTRFFGLQLNPLDLLQVADTKTSIVYFPLENHPGLLYRALAVFAENSVDLLKIESRPHPKNPFEYIFYLDFKGDPTKEFVRIALDSLRKIAQDVYILGSYKMMNV